MEMFVARHVLVRLLYGGDMDGPLDENGNPQRVVCCLHRRFVVTIGIYIATLIPALIVDDLGPVLSITGSLGGSMLSYMAPGMVYLGVNGDHFLEWTDNMLLTYRTKNGKKNDQSVGDIELPVAGDATRQIQAAEPPALSDRRKPWWWFPALMPIWCALASTGRRAMNDKLAGEGGGVQNLSNGTQADEEGDLVHPNVRDYLISIFFIVFGTIGMIAGLFSNLYVQINSIFFTPH